MHPSPRDCTGRAENSPCWLVVGNQESMKVVSFFVDNASGRLTERSSINTHPLKPCNISYYMNKV